MLFAWCMAREQLVSPKEHLISNVTSIRGFVLLENDMMLWFIRSNLSLSPEESWLPIASILFCIVHIQVRAHHVFLICTFSTPWSLLVFFFFLIYAKNMPNRPRLKLPENSMIRVKALNFSCYLIAIVVATIWSNSTKTLTFDFTTGIVAANLF